eukprot:s1133_g8.t1
MQTGGWLIIVSGCEFVSGLLCHRQWWTSCQSLELRVDLFCMFLICTAAMASAKVLPKKVREQLAAHERQQSKANPGEQFEPTGKLYCVPRNAERCMEIQDLDEAELGGNLTWFEPQSHYGRLVSYRIYLQSGGLRESLDASRTTTVSRSMVLLDEVLQGTTEVAIPPETQQNGYSHFSVYTVSALTEQTTPAMLLIDDTVARASNLSFEDAPLCRVTGCGCRSEDLDLDLRELGGNLTWQEPEDMSQVTSYDTDCVVLGHVVALVTGSFEMDLDGASEEQVTEAATQALASQIIVTVSAARRLEEVEVETRRLLATHWKVSYTAVVDVELASDVEQVVEAVSADQTAFSERMKTELVVTGVPPGEVNKVALTAFIPAVVEVVATTTTSTTSSREFHQQLDHQQHNDHQQLKLYQQHDHHYIINFFNK